MVLFFAKKEFLLKAAKKRTPDGRLVRKEWGVDRKEPKRNCWTRRGSMTSVGQQFPGWRLLVPFHVIPYILLVLVNWTSAIQVTITTNYRRYIDPAICRKCRLETTDKKKDKKCFGSKAATLNYTCTNQKIVGQKVNYLPGLPLD